MALLRVPGQLLGLLVERIIPAKPVLKPVLEVPPARITYITTNPPDLAA